VWNMLENSNRGLEHAVDLSEVCASTHQREEGGACVRLPGTAG
jgi:hypothetical protein